MVRNDTLSFLLPLLSNPRFDRDFFMNRYFIGAFIKDVDRYDYDNEIILVYNYRPQMKYYNFETQLVRHNSYSKINYMYDQESCAAYVFRIPVDLEEDFNFILKGEYHNISPESKLKISKFWNSDKGGRLYKMLYKPELSDEWAPPAFEKEVFDIMEFKGEF